MKSIRASTEINWLLLKKRVQNRRKTLRTKHTSSPSSIENPSFVRDKEANPKALSPGPCTPTYPAVTTAQQFPSKSPSSFTGSTPQPTPHLARGENVWSLPSDVRLWTTKEMKGSVDGSLYVPRHELTGESYWHIQTSLCKYSNLPMSMSFGSWSDIFIIFLFFVSDIWSAFILLSLLYDYL